MKNSNLINPYSPYEQHAFYRWIMILKTIIVFFLIFVLIVSLWQGYVIWHIKGEITLVQKKIDMIALQRYEKLCKQHQVVQEQLEAMQRWKHSSCYYEQMVQLAEKIPDQVRLSEVLFEDQAVVLKGEAQNIEYILSFIHNLQISALFQEMNLIELQPSSCIYQEKNLVYFVIKGKLV